MRVVIAIDTNVIVRYLVRDDAGQEAAARALLEGLTPERPGFICREAMLEIVQVLERAYRFSRTRITDVVLELLATDSLVVESADDIARAALDYRWGGADFADLMILVAAGRSGAWPLYTFDRRFARVGGAVLVEPA